MKIKKLNTIILTAAIISLIGAGFENLSSKKNPAGSYSLVKINITGAEDIYMLQSNDITVEHYSGNIRDGIELVINQNEISRLKSTGLNYKFKIRDLDSFYLNRAPSTQNEMQISSNIQNEDNISGFSFGSMGGYYTFNEVIQKLDSMKLQYPNLITSKINLGLSIENRNIWAVKISDNPDVNESATEAPIYFDALHHAREPQSMASLMYYMYWLLDNCGINPEATYLVNNREIFFVPVVNPDGYVYNQQTNPNGGGFWRKNRRNSGGGNYGVDINRNYDYGWGNNSGSSGDPSSETYRGPFAGSEPETQAIKSFISVINPKISFTMHSVAAQYINPFGYIDSNVSYDIYSEFASDFAASNNYLYGTVKEMLDYYSSGTTRDYLHSQGTYCWTTEVGGTSFWPAQSEIIPVASENLYALKYLSWVGGAHADLQNYKVSGRGYVNKNDTLLLQINIKNRGLSMTAKNVTAEVTTDYPNAVPLNAISNYDSISARQSEDNVSQLIKFRLTSSAVLMDEMKYIISIKQEGVETSRDTIRINVGRPDILFSDNAETGTSRWIKSGTGTLADTTFIDPYEGSKNFADSRYGNAKNSSNSALTLADTINLLGTVNPRIEFAIKWAMESAFDYFRLQISTNFGTTWLSLPGRYTKTASGQPSYTDIKHWKNEQINLNSYIGQKIRIRFSFVTNAGVSGDGYYFDNFRVVNYSDTITSVISNLNLIPDEFRLYQNYPNPFNPSTSIRYSLINSGLVTLKIFDVLGNEISTLVNEKQNSGIYNYQFSTANYPLSSGIYYYKLEAGSFSEVRKMILLK